MLAWIKTLVNQIDGWGQGRPPIRAGCDGCCNKCGDTDCHVSCQLGRVYIIVLVVSESKWLLVSQFAGASPLSPLSQCG